MTRERHRTVVSPQTIGDLRGPVLAACTTYGWHEAHPTYGEARRAADAHDPRCEAVHEAEDWANGERDLTCERMAGHPAPHRFTFEWP